MIFYMRSPYFILLTVTLLFFAGSTWYRTTANECPVPLSYRLERIDLEFSLSREQALSYISSAEAVWEKQAGRDLFVYDEEADFTINFVYDERQETADAEETKRIELDDEKDRNEVIQAELANLQDEYEKLSISYQNRVSTYEARLSDYNKEVQTYNDRGGAPADVYGDLEAEASSLEAEASSLTRSAENLNSLATEINQLAEKGNSLVKQYNRRVSTYNSEFGFSREFTQGDYEGGSINIYKFSDEAEVITVLAHEFGHALGINHVEGTSSLMYYLLENTSESPELSSNDKSVYFEVCGESVTWQQHVRAYIRAFLQKI